MSIIFHFPLHHIPHEMQFCMHSAQNILISYPVPETYLQYLSVAPHLQCIYFLSHLLVPCPTLTPVASYREHIAVENLQLCAQADIPSHYFFVCQKAALAIPTLALISSSHLASSDIQLPRYLNRVTCSNGTPSRVRHACDPFPTLSPPNTITFVFLTLISMPYSLQVSFSLSIIFCNFFLLSATNTASSAYLKSVILNPPKLMPSIPSIASLIMNSLYRLNSNGDITHPCLTPLSTLISRLVPESHLTAASCFQYRLIISLLSNSGMPAFSMISTSLSCFTLSNAFW